MRVGTVGDQVRGRDSKTENFLLNIYLNLSYNRKMSVYLFCIRSINILTFKVTFGVLSTPKMVTFRNEGQGCRVGESEQDFTRNKISKSFKVNVETPVLVFEIELY